MPALTDAFLWRSRPRAHLLPADLPRENAVAEELLVFQPCGGGGSGGISPLQTLPSGTLSGSGLMEASSQLARRRGTYINQDFLAGPFARKIGRKAGCDRPADAPGFSR